MIKNFLLLLLCFAIAANSFSQKPPSHAIWSNLLQKHVNINGTVDYDGFKKDVVILDTYLNLLSNNAPKDNWSNNEKLAYWINAYNAFTIKLIVSNYPTTSIKNVLGGKPWDNQFFKINGKSMSLSDIEHGILRKEFIEPRIHFTINCASLSCPKLLNTAFEGRKLDKQLTAQAIAFINDKERNTLDPTNPKLSKIFDWFGTDFTKTGKTKIAFINQYAAIKIKENATLSYNDYNWNLNEYKFDK